MKNLRRKAKEILKCPIIIKTMPVMVAGILFLSAKINVLATEPPQTGNDKHYTEQDVLDCAWVLWFEYGSCKSFTEKSKIIWTICNRVDDPRWADNFRGVVSQPNQFSWHGAPNTERMSEDVIAVARDVLERWNAEKNGMENVGRTLPKDSIGFWGDGQRNHFYAQTNSGARTYYELSPEEGPYEN